MDILTDPPPPADARLSYGPDPLHYGDLRLPARPGPHPVVLVVHGGFWRARYDLEHTGHLCAALTAEGLATWNVEYRRIGNAGGGWPGTFQDVALAACHLRELAPKYNLDLEHIVALGHSAGGHLALWLGGCHRVPAGDVLHVTDPLRLRGIVSLAGVADLRLGWQFRLSDGVIETFLGGAPDEVPKRYASASPAELLPLGVRQVLVHGTDDTEVPFDLSRQYQLAAISFGDDAELVALPGSGHFELIDPASNEWRSVAMAVRSLLTITAH